MWRWRKARTSAETIDLFTRLPLYLISVSEPLVLLLIIGGQQQDWSWALAVLLVLAAAHTVACVALMHAGIAHFLGGPRPSARLVGAAVALTAAGVVAAVATVPRHGGAVDDPFRFGLPAGAAALLFCAALMAAVTPLLPTRRLLVVVALPAAVAGVLQVAIGDPSPPLWATNYLTCVGGAAFTYRSSVWALGVLWELDQARDMQARLAVAEERLRFARDLHDVLGRNLTLMAVNSELAAQLVGTSQDRAGEHMLEVRRLAQDSMREMREVVAGQRATDLDSELAGARSVLRSAGINARVIGDAPDLPREAQAGLGWAVREATTNIIRHSDATTATIELAVVQEAVGTTAVLRIENDGARARESDPGSGTGLVGLQERLAVHGGDLETEALPGGRFLVQVRLPLTRVSPEAESKTEPVS
ncbi:MAG: two-component system, NarL family, sensor histidine kinase DesK [Actinomycetota bacterium]|jgi:two-component system sensor histidine kinase DesK|nr:two-component system, NarL family, sensor histidine kinase DesK [Actinomycetota bacterium]